MNAKNQKSAEQMDLLTAVENIVDLARDSALSDLFFSKAEPFASYISERMGISNEQSVMLALLIDNSDDDVVTARDLGRFLDCSTTRILRYSNYIDELEKQGFVIQITNTRRGINRTAFRVPQEVINAFKRNEKYVPRNLSGLSCRQLFDEIDNIFQMRGNEELTFDGTVERMQRLFDCNKELLFVSKIRSYRFAVEDEMLLILFAHLCVNNCDDNIGLHDLEFLFERMLWFRLRTNLRRNEHILFDTKMIEYTNNEGFVNNESLCLTTQAKRDLLSELNLVEDNARKKRNDVIKTEDIKAKNLFFSEKVSKRVDELGDLMENSQYEQIRKRLEDEKFRCGFACLFYGAPGTGKTETALQLARRTGRDVMQVNFAKIKSMWVGESEKNLKRVFDVYREKVKECDVAPILLFNEADAIIGKRSENAERSVDKMYHTMQNILLQEMETLDGIMIATTNLAQSFDRAFERRFLYKIKFDKPTVEARMSIWCEMIPSLTEDEARTLSSIYEFSGGQIENIARRNAIGTILHGDEASTLDTLIAYCNDERLDTKNQKKIGF
ncbi:MAG: ATP-binding protein [Salinivirgaceae bacterium]|nr:ATP-binding protein [Salinivirgaceae bacterium]